MPPEKPEQPARRKYISKANLAFEISEDWKLRRIGIDPDADPIWIMAELDRRVAAINKARGWSNDPEDTEEPDTELYPEAE